MQNYATGNAAEVERDQWSPGKNTRSLATDAYGTIEFQGGPHPTKAQVNIIHLIPLINIINICFVCFYRNNFIKLFVVCSTIT